MKVPLIDPTWMKIPLIDPTWMKIPFIEINEGVGPAYVCRAVA